MKEIYGLCGLTCSPCRNPLLWGTMKYLSEKIPKDTSSITSELDAIYHPYIFWYEADIKDFINYPDNAKSMINNDFIQEILLFYLTNTYELVWSSTSQKRIIYITRDQTHYSIEFVY